MTSRCNKVQTTMYSIVCYSAANDTRFGVEIIFKFAFNVVNHRLPAENGA